MGTREKGGEYSRPFGTDVLGQDVDGCEQDLDLEVQDHVF